MSLTDSPLTPSAQSILDVCDIELTPLIFVFLPVAIDLIIDFIFAYKMKYGQPLKWWHHVLGIKQIIGALLALIGVIFLWSRLLTGYHLFVCTAVFETEVACMTKMNGMIRYIYRLKMFSRSKRALNTMAESEEEGSTISAMKCQSGRRWLIAGYWIVWLIRGLLCLGYYIMVWVSFLALGLPYSWLWLPVVWIWARAKPWMKQKVEHEISEPTHLDPMLVQPPGQTEQQEIIRQRKIRLFVLRQTWSIYLVILLPVLTLMGASYFGWLVEKDDYWHSMTLLWSDRPSVADYAIHKWQGFIRWV